MVQSDLGQILVWDYFQQIRYLADTSIQSNLELIRLSRGQSCWAQRRVKGRPQGLRAYLLSYLKQTTDFCTFPELVWCIGTYEMRNLHHLVG